MTTIRCYEDVYRAFDAEAVSNAILGDPGASVNAAILCCDQHVGANRTALHAIDRDGRSRHFTFETLKDQSECFAQVLRDNGVDAGDVVACLLPRVPELFVTALAIWRLGAVYQPLFTAFGPKAIEHRVMSSGAKVIVTDGANRSKLDGFAFASRVMTVGDGKQASDLDFHAEIARRDPGLAPVRRTRDDPFLIMFTSGTTGPAKPLFVPIKAIVSFVGYMTDAVGLIPDDRYWNIADPGWGYGLYYAVVGPLALEHETMVYDGHSPSRAPCGSSATTASPISPDRRPPFAC